MKNIRHSERVSAWESVLPAERARNHTQGNGSPRRCAPRDDSGKRATVPAPTRPPGTCAETCPPSELHFNATRGNGCIGPPGTRTARPYKKSFIYQRSSSFAPVGATTLPPAKTMPPQNGKMSSTTCSGGGTDRRVAARLAMTAGNGRRACRTARSAAWSRCFARRLTACGVLPSATSCRACCRATPCQTRPPKRPARRPAVKTR